MKTINILLGCFIFTYNFAFCGFVHAGGGDYGPNSGGFDQLGYGTLMFARP